MAAVRGSGGGRVLTGLLLGSLVGSVVAAACQSSSSGGGDAGAGGQLEAGAGGALTGGRPATTGGDAGGGASGAPGGGTAATGAAGGVAGSGGRLGMGGGGATGGRGGGGGGRSGGAATGGLAASGGRGGGAAGGAVDPGHGARFVAVGYAARRLSSEDGKTWTEAPLVMNPPWSPTTPVQPVDGDNEWLLRGVCYGNGTWLAVGGNGSKGLTLLSQDGESWTLANTQMSNDDCAYGLGLFVTGRRTSADGGVTWQDAPSPPKAIRQMLFADGRFVVVGDQGGGNVSYSLDGKSWTNLPITYAGASDSDRRGYYYLTHAPGMFYAMKACCDRSDYKLFSWDGKTDTSFTETPLAGIVGTDMPEGISYVNGHLVMPGPGYYYDKPDGSSTWTKHTTPTLKGPNNTQVDRPLSFVQFGNGLYVSPTAWTPNLTDFTAATFTNNLWAGGSTPGLFRMVARP